MKRRSPFNELSDMGYKNGAWSDEENLVGPYEKVVEYKNITDRGCNGQVYLKFELLDFKYVDFSKLDKKDGEDTYWSAENIMNGRSPECSLRVIGECSQFQSKLPYSEVRIKMKKEIKKLKAQIKELEKSSKDVYFKNSGLEFKINLQDQNYRNLVENFNSLKITHGNLQLILKALVCREESKLIEIKMDDINVCSSTSVDIRNQNNIITIKIKDPDTTVPSGYLS